MVCILCPDIPAHVLGPRLRRCRLSHRCCSHLANALSGSVTLLELDLSHNALAHRGLRLLCVGLRCAFCPLEKLW